jgi:Tol biopolymer transport system component
MRRPQRGPTIALAALLVATTVGFAVYELFVRSSGADKLALPFQNTKITKMTNGRAVVPAISRDGKYVAYMLDQAGKRSLWVRQVTIANHVQLMPPDEAGYGGLIYSPDGNYLYHATSGRNRLHLWRLTYSPDANYLYSRENSALYQVPALGGVAKKLLEGVNSGVTFSPDGRKFAFIRSNKEQSNLMTANADGTEVKTLASRRLPDTLESGGAAWSPNGKVIACGHAGSFRGIVQVSVDDGTIKPLTRQKWDFLGGLAWLPDGSGLLLNATDPESPYFQIWHVSYPSGQARKITNTLNNHCNVSVTADSRTLVTFEWSVLSNIWLVPNGKSSRSTQITSGGSTYYDLSWTRDGKILYSSDASGNADIWIMNADGSDQKQLTIDPAKDYQPTMSTDGRYIFFRSNRSGDRFAIWRMNADGTDQKQLTTGGSNGDIDAHCSPDGEWIVYRSIDVEGRSPLWRVSVKGGDPMLLNDRFIRYPVVSPDGKLIACWYKPDESAAWKLAIIPFAGGPPVQIFDVVPTADMVGTISWNTDATALTYCDNLGEVSNIWLQPIAGGKPRRLTDFKTDQIFSFAWSTDGKQLLVSRGTTMSDVILINDLR